ncbi:MAG: uroporphyrinogen decarboxylase family protein [Candidatus Hermodarchaeota archaeon]
MGSVLSSGDKGYINISAQCHDHVMHLAEAPAKKFYTDLNYNFGLGALVGKYYDFDSPVGGHDAYNIEVEALGGKLIYGENSMPTIDFRQPLIKSYEDLEELKNKKIDFESAGRFPMILNSAGSMVGGNCIFCSPFSLAVGLMGFPKLIRAMKRDPQLYHGVMSFVVDDVLAPWIRTQNKKHGNLMGIGADAWASVPNLSPKEMMEYIVPYNQRLEKKCKEFGVITMNVTGDYCEERIEKFDPIILHDSFDVEIASMGGNPAIFLAMGRWHEYPLEAVCDYTEKYRKEGKGVTITAGINARLLRDGPIEKIVDNVKRFIDAFARDHSLTIFLSNVPADTPSEHIHAAVAAAHTYGKFPIADNLDKIELKIPKKKSFKEWRIENEASVRAQMEEEAKEERCGLAGLLWQQLGAINQKEKFKKEYADAKMSFLYRLTDQRYSALITIENGTLDVKHLESDGDVIENLEVDGSISCTASLFFDFTGGKISKVGMLIKMLTGKLKVKGAKKMQELASIMAL